MARSPVELESPTRHPSEAERRSEAECLSRIEADGGPSRRAFLVAAGEQHAADDRAFSSPGSPSPAHPPRSQPSLRQASSLSRRRAAW